MTIISKIIQPIAQSVVQGLANTGGSYNNILTIGNSGSLWGYQLGSFGDTSFKDVDGLVKYRQVVDQANNTLIISFGVAGNEQIPGVYSIVTSYYDSTQNITLLWNSANNQYEFSPVTDLVDFFIANNGNDITFNATVGNVVLDLDFPLTHNLYGSIDNVPVTANLTRAAGIATVEDFENVVHECKDGEARFWKARRVENAYQGNSDTIDTLTFLVIVGKYYILSIESADGGTAVVELNGLGLAGSAVAQGAARARIAAGTATGTGTATIILHFGNAKNIHIDVYDSEVDVNLYENEYVESHLDHGANVLGVKYFNTDRSGALLTDLRYCLTEEADAGYDPNSGIQGTTVAETLSIPLPAVLNKPTANNLRIEFDSYTVRDNVDGITTKIQYMIQGDAISNVLRLTSGTGGGRQFRKVINGTTYNTDVVEGSPLSRRRKQLTTISSTDGMTLDIDGVIDTNSNTDAMITFDAGDGLLWLGSNPTGGQVANSGFGNVKIKSLRETVIDLDGDGKPDTVIFQNENITITEDEDSINYDFDNDGVIDLEIPK